MTEPLSISMGEGLPTEPSATSRVATGRVHLSPSDPHLMGEGLQTEPKATEPRRREYFCTLLTPGFVKAADGTDTDWLIPAHVVNRDAHLFDGVASYLDHPELVGLGWRGEPQVKNLVGVVSEVRWDVHQEALVGVLRLYDEGPNSPGAFVGHLADQILADAGAGLPVPEIGLSAVFYHEAEQDEHTGHRITRAFT